MTALAPRRLVLAAALAAAAPALAPLPAAADRYEDVKVMAGEALFVRECRRCHAPDSDHPSYGPPLIDIIAQSLETAHLGRFFHAHSSLQPELGRPGTKTSEIAGIRLELL